jgi:nucleotide-binding universal stress UspA family protein
VRKKTLVTARSRREWKGEEAVMMKFKTVLVAKDFSECSERALETGIQLARKTGADLHVVYVHILHDDPFIPAVTDDHLEKVEEALRTTVGETAGVRVTQSVLRDVAAAPAIVHYAGQNDIDVIVVGTHGRRGFRHAFLGSVAEEVVRTAPCAVLTVHQGDRETALMPGPEMEVLLPLDFSSRAAETIPVAREIAESMRARLRILHVVEETMHPAFYNAGAFSIYDLQPDIEERALENLTDLYARSAGPVVPVVFDVIIGHAVTEIVSAAFDHEAGMIVMSTHGLRGLAHFFMGSVAERVVRLATCPVLTLRSPESLKLAPEELADEGIHSPA